MRITRSASTAASRSASVIRSGSSPTIAVTCASHPISPAWAASINELVSTISPGAEVGSDRSDLVACRDDRHLRPPSHHELGCTRRRAGRDVDRPQPVPDRQQKFRCGDVLTDRANVLIRRHRGAQLGTTVGRVVHVFAHDDSVIPHRERIAGVDQLRTRRHRAAPVSFRWPRPCRRPSLRCHPSPRSRRRATSAAPTPARP